MWGECEKNVRRRIFLGQDGKLGLSPKSNWMFNDLTRPYAARCKRCDLSSLLITQFNDLRRCIFFRFEEKMLTILRYDFEQHVQPFCLPIGWNVVSIKLFQCDRHTMPPVVQPRVSGHGTIRLPTKCTAESKVLL